jgi:LuxR family quorum-sensing system transcriptional regulator SolR
MLTRRELECFFCLLMGRTFKEIGKQLNISARTVEYYSNSLKLKLKCFRKSELIDKGVEFGLVSFANINPRRKEA